MKQRLAGLFSLLAFLMVAGLVQAQPSKTLPTNPGEFIAELSAQLKKFGNKEVQQYAESFEEKWTVGKFTNREQERFISQVNIMLLKNYSPNPDVLNYVRTFDAIKKEEAFAKIDPEQFFLATDSCVLLMDRKRTSKFFSFMQEFVATGKAFKTSNASWQFTQADPQLKFGTFLNTDLGKKVSFPYLTFSGTDLKYRNSKDSTLITGTHGDFNIMNKMFNGEGGKIDWSKMKLNAAAVYCELFDYGLNLNYSFVKIDTVLFHYAGLIDKPLKGKFEDINKGYQDINKANYPYFRSYDGGVVIENFIPNVRYEGGFSLRGIRKIGSAFFKEVEIEDVAAPDEDEEEVVEVTEEDDFGYEYDDNAYYLDEEDEGYVEDTWGDEEDMESESEDELGGGDFDEMDMDFLSKEVKLFKAQLTIFRQGERAMNLRANEFVLDLKTLVSRRTEVALYLNKEDSISHPSVEVIYNVDSMEVYLIKNVKDKLARQPFVSPYHNYYLYFDAIRWRQNTNIIEFTSLIDRENQTSAIESKDFFKKQRWNQFKGILRFNPIGAIYRYTSLHPGEEIYAQSIIDEYKLPDQLTALEFALVDVEGSGFINYDKKTGEITPLDKLFDWAKGARGRKDYDAIQVISQVKAGNNAELDLDNLNIDMYGVAFFPLSDSQFVRVLPNQSHVKVKKNRDMEFDGVVAAGKLDFYGRMTHDTVDMGGIKGKFTFQYDNYKILVDSLDSLRFVLVRKNQRDLNTVFSPLQKALRKTTIEGVTGAIYINKPNNKNGLEPLAEYPVFDSYTNSYVYWYKPNVRNGVYTKEKLFFSIDPFVLDSLESFDESALSFEGEFNSSEIFPKIRQRLTVMEDFTLGLKDITPDTGYAVYDGAGRFSGEIVLDGGGLSSKGQMDFLHTVAKSDSFEHYFDSVKAVTNEFFLPGGEKDGVYFPEIKANAVNYKWLTKKDEIELETMDKGEAIVMFEGEGVFEGKLVITPEGLKGSGKLTMGNVIVESNDILFGEKDFQTQGGTFAVTDDNDPTKQLYVASNVNVKYDISGHHSTFEAQEVGKPSSEFPEQHYMSSLGKGEYDRGSNDIRLESRSAKLKNNYFYSTDKLQDSLAYYAQSAHYNFDRKEIEIAGVPYIYVADAKITPDTGLVTVKQNGFMEKLEDAVIDANLETGYHRIYNSTVEVTSSKRYTGDGKYDYIPVGGKDQFIKMSEIKVQGDTLTTAKGTIPEEQGFYLTDRIFFKGTTALTADQKYMKFSGEVKIDSENEFFSDKWFVYEDVVNPDSIFIKINQGKLGNLVVGLHYIKRNRVYYSRFLQAKKEKTHVDVALAVGGLTFDRDKNEFRIGPKKKLTGLEYRGTTSSLNDSLNIITTAGKLNIPFNWNKNTIEVGMAGTWKDDMGNREVVTDLVGAFNFDCIPKDAWSKWAEKSQLVTAINEDLDWNSYALREGLSEFLDPNYRQPDKLMKGFLKEIEKSVIYNDIKVAKNLPYSLVLSGIQFRYDEDYKVFYHSGPVGIIGVNTGVVNKMSSTNTKIEYSIGKYTPAGVMRPDTLRMYLELDELNWIYFEYADNVLNTISTDLDGYNGVLRTALEKRKKNDGYRFELTDELAKDDFLQKFVTRYIWRTNRPAPRFGGDDDDDGGDDDGGDDTGGDGQDGGDNGDITPPGIGDDDPPAPGGDDTGDDEEDGGDNNDITPPGMGDDDGK